MRKIIRVICLMAYYGFARYLPASYVGGPIGKLSGKIRYLLCRGIFRKCGKNVNVERGAYFAGGARIEIGNNSGLGVNCRIPQDVVIGDYVMMGPNCRMFANNHCTERTDIPMGLQGDTERRPPVIGSDVWIAEDVMIMPGVTVADGTIIAARCVLTRDFPPYSVVGGVPGRLLKLRK